MNALSRPPIALYGLLLLAPFALAIGCGKTSPPPRPDALQQVELQLNWFPDAQHGGFYAAQIHGDFAAAGLDVTIVAGGPNVPVVQSVASRRVAFAVGNADQVLLGREQGADVVALFAAMQNSPRCILVREDAGIERFEDLHDVTLALGSGKSFAQFLQTRLPLENVRIVPYSGSIAALLRDKRYAQQGYVFSEPLVARRQGVEVRSLMVSDLGFNPYTSLLMTHGQLIAEDPQLVGRMMRAVRRGWQRYLESPEETNRKIHELNSEMDLESLEFAAQAIRPLCLPASLSPSAVGQMTAERWQTLANQLATLGLISPKLDASAPFTNQFLSDDDASSEPRSALGLSKVQVWIQNDDDELPSDDRYFVTAPWSDAEVVPPPVRWGGGLAENRIPSPTDGFDPQTGKPLSWPVRLTKAHWAVLLPGLPVGNYTLRSRTIDAHGIAQPLPRPFRKSGRAAISQISFTVKN